MSTLITFLLADAISEVKKDWVTVNGRHIFFGTSKNAKDSSKAWAASKTAKTFEEHKKVGTLHQDIANRLYDESAKFGSPLSDRGVKQTKEGMSLYNQAIKHESEADIQWSQSQEVQTLPKLLDAIRQGNYSSEDQKLMEIGTKIGFKAFGPGSGELGESYAEPDPTLPIQRLTVKDGMKVGTFYTFKPSTGRMGHQGQDDEINFKGDADKDGKVYLVNMTNKGKGTGVRLQILTQKK
jgi:hypothetical protein